eukprot:1156069-Pelagomonas_calceolata.AAC.3
MQGLHSSMDMGNESAGGEDEAITAAGPTHHMALLQQAACAAAAANEGPYTRRPSSHSNTSQTDIVNMSQSSRRSSPSSGQPTIIAHHFSIAGLSLLPQREAGLMALAGCKEKLHCWRYYCK